MTSSPRTNPSLEIGDAIQILNNPDRLQLLRVLSAHEGEAVTVDELVATASDDHPTPINILNARCYHMHFPMLEEFDVVTHHNEQDKDTVVYHGSETLDLLLETIDMVDDL